MGAEEHAHRPGWGGGRQVGLDTPPIWLRGRRAPGSWPRSAPKGRRSCARCSNSGCSPPGASPWACRAYVRRGHPGDPRRPAVSPGGVGDALSGKKQKPKKTANPGSNPGNPRKWARTDESEQPKRRRQAAMVLGQRKQGGPPGAWGRAHTSLKPASAARAWHWRGR